MAVVVIAFVNTNQSNGSRESVCTARLQIYRRETCDVDDAVVNGSQRVHEWYVPLVAMPTQRLFTVSVGVV